MKFTKKLLKYLLSFKTLLILIPIIAIVIFLILKNKGSDQELFTVTSDSLAATGITVSGTVVAQQEVELSFETSGRVSQVVRKAGDRTSLGDVIASLDTSSISANILKAQADLDAEVAKLEQIKNQEKIDLNEIESKKHQLARELRNAYIVADDSIKNKTDQFFENPDGRFPEILFIFDDYSLRKQINSERYRVGLLLKSWVIWSDTITKDNYTDATIRNTKDSIIAVQNYLNLISTAVNKFEASDTYPQTTIDKYKTDTSSARSNMNTALNSLISAQESVKNTVSQIPYQEARIKAAEANVKNLEAELQKSVIRAPFNGLITRQDAKVGMGAFADQKLVSMISDSNYRIDTYIPEIYISQVEVGNKAKVTLNSYGALEKFDATVTFIDPAASLRDGVASYKVELVFDNNDERIKSGMTGDVEILTETINPAFWIPSNAIINQGGVAYVKIKNGEYIELRKVQIGDRNDDESEVMSGIVVGDQLVIEKKE